MSFYLGEWQAHIENGFRRGVDGYFVYMFKRLPSATEFLTADGTVYTVERSDEGKKIEKDYHFMVLEQEQMQRLADALADAGFVAQRTRKYIEKYDAVDAHLQDMRKIAFKKLGISE